MARSILASLDEVTKTRAPTSFASCRQATATPSADTDDQDALAGLQGLLAEQHAPGGEVARHQRAGCDRSASSGKGRKQRLGIAIYSAKPPWRCSPMIFTFSHSGWSPARQ
jgi:hypothetical protein